MPRFTDEDVSRTDAVSIAIDVFMIFSRGIALLAAVFLAQVELIFMRVEMADLEDLHGAEEEYALRRRLLPEARTERHRPRALCRSFRICS
jgi:hypothetical protein